MRYLAAIMAFIFISSTATAQEIPEPPRFELVEPTMTVGSPPSDIQALQTILDAGDRAPYDGILLNQEALSWIMTSFVFVQRNLIEEMQRRVGITRLWGRTNIEMHRVEIEAQRAAFQVQLETIAASRDRALREVEVLSRDVGWSRREKVVLVLSLLGSLAVGALLGWGISKLP